MKARVVVAFVACWWLAAAVFAQPPGMGGPGGQMPDPKQMSGMPLPVGDLSPGSVSVRVIRGSLANPLKGQTVTLTGAGAPRAAQTDDAGRAEFSGLTPGTRVQASVTVGGEKIDSQQFDVPATGGIRLMLVATDPEAEKKAEEDRRLAQEPPIQGTVVIGDQSRFVIEMGDDGVNVFNILQVINTARRPVTVGGPLVFELPAAARGAGMLEGSTPNAVVTNGNVAVSGPFPPGSTTVQFAYTLPFGSDAITITQKMPAQLTEFTLLAQKAGAMSVSSPQMQQHRDMTADGQNYTVGQGPAVRAGDTVTIVLSGLPHHPVWPRYLALTLASAILVGGVWAARRRSAPEESAKRRRLQERRERLFADLAALEQQRRDGAIDPARYAARRQELLGALEAVYAQLDEQAAA
jgi:hypothetical protein